MDPEYVEAMARSIENELGRGNALAWLAQAMAAADPERADALARSIEDASSRARRATAGTIGTGANGQRDPRRQASLMHAYRRNRTVGRHITSAIGVRALQVPRTLEQLVTATSPPPSRIGTDRLHGTLPDRRCQVA